MKCSPTSALESQDGYSRTHPPPSKIASTQTSSRMNTNIDRTLLGAMALLLCGITGCGGGGGEQAPVPAPAPAPAPAPPGPPSVDSTKVSLTQLPSTCASGMGCLLAWNVLVDSSGEATAVWSEFVSTGSSRIVASNVPLGAAASSSSAIVESSFARPAVPNLIVRAVAPGSSRSFTNTGPTVCPPMSRRTRESYNSRLLAPPSSSRRPHCRDTFNQGGCCLRSCKTQDATYTGY